MRFPGKSSNKPERRPSSVYELRYEVYCKERRFLRSIDYPDGREMDKYDRYSVHFAALNRNNEVVGAVRLVMPGPRGQFPFEAHCPLFPDISLPPRATSAEISRLVVMPRYRRPTDETLLAFSGTLLFQQGVIAPAEGEAPLGDRRLNRSRVVMGLYRRMYRYGKKHGITHVYAAMEKSLHRMLARYGFPFHVIGEESDYYGRVTPYLLSMDELEHHLQHHHPELLEWLAGTLERRQ